MEVVNVPDWLTWQRFGCYSEEYFEKFIKNKPLSIVFTFGKVLMLQDENGDQWPVFQSDLNHNKKQAEEDCFPWIKNHPESELTALQQREQAELRYQANEVIKRNSKAKEKHKNKLAIVANKAFGRLIIDANELATWIALINSGTESELTLAIQTLESKLMQSDSLAK